MNGVQNPIERGGGHDKHQPKNDQRYSCKNNEGGCLCFFQCGEQFTLIIEDQNSQIAGPDFLAKRDGRNASAFLLRDKAVRVGSCFGRVRQPCSNQCVEFGTALLFIVIVNSECFLADSDSGFDFKVLRKLLQAIDNVSAHNNHSDQIVAGAHQWKCQCVID